MSIFRKSSLSIALAAAAMLVAQPAMAQFSDSYNFLKAVKDRDGAEAEKFLNEPGSVIVTARRDTTWLAFLLQKGANPNLADRKGVTPLMVATQLGFAEGAATLLKYKANVDGSNRSGETALIRAVQLRNPEMVRLLLKSGANPDKRDSVAGLSARDYAAQDGRSSAILGIIERKGEAAPEPEKKQGDLDFSGIGEPK
jgi:uncharacterized protein